MTLPTFLIAGGRRCGTSSLYHWMRGHPDVRLPDQQDTMYFVDGPLRSRSDVPRIDLEGWDTDHDVEDYARRFESATQYTAIGEKCADILFWEPATRRLATLVPQVRLVITLRDPVTRAWSQYWNEVGKGRETLPFDDALAAEEQRANESDWARFHLSYAARGRYDESVGRILALFPRDQVLTLVMERTLADPAAALRRVYTFLGVDPERGHTAGGSRHNQNWTTVRRPWVGALGLGGLEAAYGRGARRLASRMSRGRADRATRERRLTNTLCAPFRRPAAAMTMDAGLRARLREQFAPSVARLAALLGDDLPEWRA